MKWIRVKCALASWKICLTPWWLRNMVEQPFLPEKGIFFKYEYPHFEGKCLLSERWFQHHCVIAVIYQGSYCWQLHLYNSGCDGISHRLLMSVVPFTRKLQYSQFLSFDMASSYIELHKMKKVFIICSMCPIFFLSRYTVFFLSHFRFYQIFSFILFLKGFYSIL